jgi:hypothetical protein
VTRGLFATILALFVIGALVATGCGGDSTAEDGSITKAEYISQADKICKEAEKEKTKAINTAFAAQKKTGKNFTKAQQEGLVTDVALPPIETMTEELDDLPLPKEGEAQVTSIIEGLEGAIAKAKADPASVFSEEEPFEAPKNQAEKFGFKACSGF